MLGNTGTITSTQETVNYIHSFGFVAQEMEAGFMTLFTPSQWMSVLKSGNWAMIAGLVGIPAIVLMTLMSSNESVGRAVRFRSRR
jgi:hypothetical protein